MTTSRTQVNTDAFPPHSDLVSARIGIGLVITAAGIVCIWALRDARASQADALATWAAALALVVTAFVALARKGSHAGWFHPLSLPFAVIAVMSLGAPLWVYFTHEPVGLLYDNGYQSANASSLATAVSVRACEALALALAGYLTGVGAALALTRQAESAVVRQQWPLFRYRDMRRAGLTLMMIGAVAQLGVAALERGTTYGVNQVQTGWSSSLSPAAGTTLLAGLILVTVTATHSTKPRCLRNLLRGREWMTLSLYFGAVIVTGGRGQLISPVVYLAWIYSTQVRVIPLKGILAGVLVALIGSTVISNYRQGDGLWPGSPGVVMQNAMGDVSSSAWLTQQTVNYVPSIDSYMHGSTYLAALEGQLPGPLSRATGAPTRTASAVFRNISGFTNPDQGFAESYPSEAYLNFGFAGCLGAGLFLGALMGWAWRKLRTVATRSRDLLYPVLLAGLIYGFRSDALTQIKDVLYPTLMVWAVIEWCRLSVTAKIHFPQSPMHSLRDSPATFPHGQE